MSPVRPFRPFHKVFIPLVAVAAALLAGWHSQRQAPTTGHEPGDQPRSPPAATRPDVGQRAAFDFYLLVLSSHPAFCANGHSRKSECQARPIPLSIHGLWPERLEPGRYPRDCPGPALELRPAVAASLADLMPGMAEGLHQHEWRKHGTCTGLEDDAYFTETLLRARAIDAALARTLTTLAGGRTSAVGSYSANDWGLYDVHGNVWEWVADWSPPAYPVLRGGSFLDPAKFVRSANRTASKADARQENFGFRCARSAER